MNTLQSKIVQFRNQNAPQVIFYLAIIYAVGLAGLSIPSTRGMFILLTPVNLILGTLLLLIFHRQHTARFYLFFFLICLAGYVAELVGVRTGVIFGEYTYGSALGPKIMDVPPLIGINWFLLVYCTASISSKMRLPLPAKAAAAALLMVCYDVLLEPVAIRLDFWEWSGAEIPLRNYFAWFLLALAFQFLLQLFRVNTENRLAAGILVIQLLFFAILQVML